MPRATARLAAVLAATLLPAAPALAGGGRPLPTTGTWWEITTEMEMKGMPFAMPATAVKVCTGEEEDDQLPEEPGCTYTTLGRTGSTVRWKMSCPSQGVEGTGENTFKKDAWTGVTQIHSKDGDMVMKSRGRKVGPACNPREERAKAEARNEQVRQQAKESGARSEQDRRESEAAACREGVKRVRASDFNPKTGCKDPAARAELCQRLQTREGWELAGNRSMTGDGNRSEVARLCQADLAALERRWCQEALQANDLGWLRRHCPVEVKVVVKRECAGRDYTSTAEKFRDFCAAAATEAMGPSATGEVEAGRGKAGKKKRPAEPRDDREASEDEAPAKGKGAKDGKPPEDALQKGRKLLQGVLGF